MYTVQYIVSGRNKYDEQVILWRHGDYNYEIEINAGLSKKVTHVNGEYYDALAKFEEIIASSEILA